MSFFIKTGQYTGNGTSQSISGIGFTPVVVFLHSTQTVSDSTGTKWKSTGMADTASLGENGRSANEITSIDSDGFSVGTSLSANQLTAVYHYACLGGTDVFASSYSGNATDSRNITGVGFQPIWVMIQGGSGHTFHKMDSTGASTDTAQYGTQLGNLADRIQALQSDGFQIGLSNEINQSGVTFYYFAIKASAQVKNSSYAGNGSDNVNVTGVGFIPEYVFIKQNSTAQLAAKPSSLAGDSSFKARASTGTSADLIQALQADGFQIGTAAEVNASSNTYQYIAFGPNLAVKDIIGMGVIPFAR